MPLSKEDLEKYIKNSIPDSTIIIEDLRGDGDHYVPQLYQNHSREKLK